LEIQDQKIGFGKLTSTTAWRYWDWDPSNDRDFTGLEALSKSQNPSKHRNWSQEIRYAGEINSRLSGVIGLYYIDQEIKTNGVCKNSLQANRLNPRPEPGPSKGLTSAK
jgi:iron complex outermembrane receptor protein